MENFIDMRLAAQAQEKDHPMLAQSVSADECANASSAIYKAFSWEDSAEGADFWIYITQRLQDIADLGDG
jgi:hypothetical protein